MVQQGVYAYTSLAMIYDLFMKDIPYDKMVQQLVDLWEKQGCQVRTVLDAGCGTGSFTVPLAKAGYDTCGVDISAEMLAMADQKAFCAEVSCLFIEEDLCELNLAPQFDSVISFFDTFNYLVEKQDLLAALSNVYRALKEGGTLVFDMRTMHYYQSVLGDNLFHDEKDGCCLYWENHYEAPYIYMDLDFFVPNGKGAYRRYREQHEQCGYELITVCRLLKAVGFRQVMLSSGLEKNWCLWEENETAKHRFDMLEKEERVFFWARK